MERRMGLVANGMATRGHSVHIAYLREGRSISDAGFADVTLHQIPARGNYDARMFFRLRSLIKQVKPDIIQTWTAQMDILGSFVARAAKPQWILMEPSSKGAYTKVTWKDRVRHCRAKRATVVSNSLAGDTYWRDKPALRREVIRNGQDVPRILAAPEFDKSRLPLNGNETVLCYVGRLNSTATRAKNLQACLDVVSQLSPQIPLKLLVCGDGSERERWEQKVAEAGLKKQVVFLGYLQPDEVWGVMKIADGLLSMSRFEGCPNVIQEAMLCRCPLIVSDIPEHREILSDREAIFVKSDSPVQLGHAVEALINDNAHTAERARKAYDAAQDWTVEHMLDQYEQLYQELAMRT